MARCRPGIARLSPVVWGVLPLALACNAGDLTLPAENQPAALTPLQGNAQVAIVGGTLPESLVVRVTDSRRLPVPQVRVAFVLMTPSAGGSVTPDTGVTDQNGRVAARWTLGPRAGSQLTEARLVGSDQLKASFTATASPGSVATFALVGGNKQTAPAGSVLPDSLVVRAVDGGGNPVPGLLVHWSTTGGGTVSSDQVPTGADGRSAVRRTLGPTAGDQSTIASASNAPGSPITFVATAATGSAATFAITTQPASVASAGAVLSRQPSVQLRDNLGNPVRQQGIIVTVDLGSGPGATLAGDHTQPTDASGAATFSGLAINGPAGTYTLRFSGQGVNPAVSDAIDLRAGPVSASRSSLTAIPSSIIVFANRSTVTVTVRDALGNLIEGATVVPSSSDPGTSNLTPTSAGTNASGVAIFTFGASAAKTYTISARANNVDLQDRASVQASRASTSTAIRSFSPQSSTALEPVTVAFAVSSSSGSGTPTGTVTVSDGSQTCSAPVSQGSCTLTPTTAGNKTFTASYAGSDAFEPSSGKQTHSIDLVPTLVAALTSSLPFGSFVGQTVIFTATLQAMKGVASGIVTFRENSCGSGGTLLGSGTLKPTGDAFVSEASFSTRNLSVGSHSIFACYGGNDTFASSQRGPVVQQVFRNQ
jgi:Bacterial Ig-like domain (group 3)/Bacterial Ig-like domain (group 1)